MWPNLDVEFLTTFILSIMKSIDVRAESAVKLLSEFLDMDESYVEGTRHPNAEHFAHELYCYLRSPYRDLYVYDSIVQYDLPSDLPPPPTEFQSINRWRPRPESRLSSPSSIGSSHPSLHVHDDQPRYRRTSSEKPTAPRSPRHSRSRSRSWSKNGNSDRSETRHDNVHNGDHHAARFPNHDVSGNMTLDSIDSIPVGVKGKGKAREMNSRSEESSRAGEDSMDAVVETSAPMKSPGTSLDYTVMDQYTAAELGDYEPVRRYRRVRGRGRTLLESVYSHLSLPLANVNSPARQRNVLDSAPDSDTAGSPSLLARLSDPETQNTALLESNVPVGKEPLQPGIPSFSAPEIMARTRIRLAKLKNETVAGIPPSTPTPPLTPSALSSTSNAPTSLRNKLLGKLEEERRQVNDGVQPVPSTTETESFPNSDDALNGESLKVESNLRMQAQLRVRLTAAKRARDNHDSNTERMASNERERRKRN